MVYATRCEVAQQSDVVIICVTGALQVEEVVAAERGLLEGLRHGAVIIDCFTSLPETSEKLAPAIRERRGNLLDAPITRLAKDSRAGRLNLLVGGDLQVLESVRDVLDAFTENITHVGRLGNGHRMKLIHNFVSVGFMTLLAEAAAHANSQRVDMKVFVNILATGGGASTALQRLSPYMLERDAQSVPYSITNAAKDIAYFLEIAAQSDAASEVALGVASTLQRAAQDHAQSYLPKLIELLSKSSDK